MIRATSSFEEVREYMEDFLSKAEIQMVVDHINEQLDEGEYLLRRSGSKDDLLDEIFAEDDDGKTVPKKWIIEALEENGIDDYEWEEDGEEFELEDDDDSQDADSDGETALERAARRDLDSKYAALMTKAINTYFIQDNAQKLKLHDFQENAVSKLNSLRQSGCQVLGLQLPTGSGKTVTAHHFALEQFLSKGENVLVLVPTWEIACQHASSFCRVYGDQGIKISRIGGDAHLVSFFAELGEIGSGSIFGPGRGEKGRLVITTIDTFHARSRSKQINGLVRFALVIKDEAHWGWKKKKHRSMDKFVEKYQCRVLHLTATPKRAMEKGIDWAANLTYLDLRGRYLATCKLVNLSTGETFDPEFRQVNGREWKTLTGKSLSEISNRSSRIKKIVGESVKRLKGQTIYYAGTIKEAMAVQKEFQKFGFTSGVVHSKWRFDGDKINAVTIEDFRTGRIQVLVNVQVLTMGFDVPNVETVIVARPVTSDILFTQMCGRGTRLDKRTGKTEFILIDVHDTIQNPAAARMFQHGEKFYSGSSSSAPEHDGSVPSRATSRSISPVHSLFRYTPNLSLSQLDARYSLELKPVDGFSYRDGQSFGVEIELTWDRYNESSETENEKIFGQHAHKLLAKLRQGLGSKNVAAAPIGEHHGDKDYSVWNVEWDGSCGLELVSPVLMGESGFCTLARALSVLQEYRATSELKFNYRTGTHVHLGWRSQDTRHTGNFLKLWCNIEPSILPLLAPSRVFEFKGGAYDRSLPNSYCAPLSFALGKGFFRRQAEGEALLDAYREYTCDAKHISDSRYLAVNLQNVEEEGGTVEFRSLQGTDDFQLITAWICLCMVAVERASRLDNVALGINDLGKLPSSFKSPAEQLRTTLTSPDKLQLPEKEALSAFLLEKRLEESLKNWSERDAIKIA